jgi:GAF domain-containing protein
MATRIARFTTWAPDDIELPSGVVYQCKQITAGGMDLLQRVTGSEAGDVTRAELVDEVVYLLGAPRADVLRCSVEELIAVLVASAMPAQALQDALQSDAEKNAESGAAAQPTPRKKAKP